MNLRYKHIIEKELIRLDQLGWEQPIIDSDESSENVRSLMISFPSKLFEEEDNGYDSLFNRHRSQAIIGFAKTWNVDLIWEIGAGNGQISQNLIEHGINVIAVEPLITGVKKLSSLSIQTFLGTLGLLKLPDESIKAIGIFDVLEHIEKPNAFLEEINRVLEPGGYLFTTVPAGQYLFSNFDLSIGHFRRYSKTQLKKQLDLCGFETKSIKYQFFIFILPVFILRRIPYLLNKKIDTENIHKKNKDHKILVKYFNLILELMLRFESKTKLPIGFSLSALSVKKTKKLSN
jgi:2-polyprenyl-3-methyl-5-hydroxy-6-metoxy-1,4-benzoquinol methylase